MIRNRVSTIHRCPKWMAASVAAICPAAFGAEPSGAGGDFQTGFHALDWLVVAAYAATLLAVGFYYYRREQTTEAYFNADRNMKPFMAGISLFATLLSTISYIAIPGEFVQNGPIFALLYIAALPFTFLATGWLIIPAIMRLRVTSAYELLETRLGLRVRILGAVTFLLTRLVWMALLLYTTSSVLVNVMGWDESIRTWLTILTGLITTVYALCGGIRAVVVTDVVQFFVLLLGAVLTLASISVKMDGVGVWWPTQGMPHWAPQPLFSFDPHVRITMVGTFVGTIIWWTCTSGSDQLAIQRYLSTRDAATARRAFLLNNMADAIVTGILTLVGVALLGFYRLEPGALPESLTLTKNGDALFAHYIGHYLPIGVTGLVVSGLLAAAMSSLSSGINSVIAVFSKDIIETARPDAERTESSKIRTARALALAIGIITVAGSTAMGAVPGNLLEVANKTVNLFVCPMFGLFFLAMFVPFGTPFGAVMGALYSFASAVLVGYWDLITGWDGLSFQWIAPVSLVVSVAAGCGFSVWPTRGRSWPVLAGYSAFALMPIAALFAWLKA
jgi:SSS family solute:Na+ symporter